MIRDDLAHRPPSRRSRTAGLPEPAAGIVLDPPEQRDHGDWATPVALRCRQAGGRRQPARDRRARSRPRSRRRPCRTWPGSRSPGPASSTSSSRPTWLHDVLRTVVADGRPVRHVATRSPGRRDQPRVRLGEPDRTAARGRRPLGRGRRRDRQPARGAGRGGAPGVLPERRRQPARQVPRLAATRATAASSRPTTGTRASTSSTWRPSCAPSSATTSTPDDGVRVGLPQDRRRACRTTSAASACTSTPGSRSATLHERGDVADVLARARRARGHLRGRRRDVAALDRLRRPRATACSSVPTARRRICCNDLAYHRDKFARGFTHLIDIWGADHHGQVKSLQAGMRGARLRPPGEPEIMLGQFVKLVQDGERGPHLEAHRQHHHARRHPRRGRSRRRAHDVPAAGHRLAADVRPRRRHRAVDGEPRVLRAVRARADRVDRPQGRGRGRRAPRRSTTVDLALLDARARRRAAARARAVSRRRRARPPRRARRRRSRTWVRDFARAFHGFYRDCRVLTDDAELTQARLWLTEACRIGLANALGLLGVQRARRDGAPRRRRRRRTRDDADARRSTSRCCRRRRRVDADGALSRSPGSTWSSSPSEFGTPLYVYDEDELRAPVPRRTARGFGAGVAYASKAFLCTAMARLVAEEGLGPRRRDRRRAARRAARRVPGRTHRVPRQQQVGRRAASARSQRRRRSDRRRLVRRARPARARSLASGASGAAVLVRVTPGVEAHTHEFIETGTDDSKFGFGLDNGDALAAVDARRRQAGRCASPGSHCHIGSQVFRLDSFARAVDKMVGLVRAIETETGATRRRAESRRRARRALPRGDDAPPIVEQYARACRTRSPRRSPTHGVRSRPAAHDRARPFDRRARRPHALPRRHDQGDPRRAHVRRGRRRHERQPASGHLRRALRGVPSRHGPRRRARSWSTVAGKHCEQGDILVARRAAARPTSRWATCSRRR